MSQRTVLQVLIATALFACAVWIVRATPRRAPGELARELARPWLLPALWSRLDAAERRGDLAAAAAIGRDILRYIPNWTDGHVHFAGRIAFDLGSRQQTADAALTCLDAATAWLEQSARATPDPAQRARLWAAQALFIEARCQSDPELAARFRARDGRDPGELALAALDRALAAAPDSRVLRERRAFLLVDVVAAAIRTDDRARAIETLDTAIGLLRQVEDPEASMPWVEALVRVRPAIAGNEANLDALRADPYLEDIVRALERR